MPAGTTIKMQPAESLDADGTVDQASIKGGGAGRGTDVFATYTTHGDADGETWHPQFNYFGMQWVQVTGLPEGYTPTAETDHRPAGPAPRRPWPVTSGRPTPGSTGSTAWRSTRT